MSKKIIVSSFSLYSFLNDSQLHDLDGDEAVKIHIRDGEFEIPDISESKFYCEHRGEGFETAYISKLRKLRDILSKVSDQPLVIIFDGVNIEITNIDI